MSKTFQLSDCLIGFDMDHTLIRYNLLEMKRHLFRSFSEYLVEQEGYSPLVLSFDPWADWEGFALKGIVFDKLTGNFIWLDHEKKVQRACHGTRLVYAAGAGDGKTIEEEEEFLKGTHVYSGPIDEFDVEAREEYHQNDRFHAFVTGFDFPLLSFLAQMVDLIDNGLERKGAKPSQGKMSDREPSQSKYVEAFEAVIRGFDYNFSNFGEGYYYPPVQREISKLILKRDGVRDWILQLRRQNIPVFMITNSGYEYCELLMREAFGVDWKTLFDFTVVDAKKPIFFSGSHPFHELDLKTGTQGELMVTKDFLPHQIYFHGNAKTLQEILFAKCPTKPKKIAYFGDNLLTDVMATKLNTDWIPIAILEELEDEIEHEEEQKDQATGRIWDGFLKTKEGKISYWNRFVTLHASLCISDVSVLAKVPLDHQFTYGIGSPLCYFLE